MSSNWQCIDSGFLSPEAIMAKDADLLAQLDPQGDPILHVYDWDAPCFTYGYFNQPERFLDLEKLQRYGVQKARRPTGGGIIFHLSDFAFSILIPASHPHFSLNTLENYAFINSRVAAAVAHFTLHSLQPELLVPAPECVSQGCHAFCMAKPTQYDLMVQGKKVGGAAQRKTKQGFLHQGSLFLLPLPEDLLRKVLKDGESVVQAMLSHSDYLLSQELSSSLESERKKIKEVIKEFVLST